jgi:hypothetical protein
MYKNRLFIERDSKNRRVMNNFGLTFRNSKWSDYSTSNVNINTRHSFFKSVKTFFQIISSLLLLWCIIFHTDTLLEISFLSETLWFLTDVSSSYITFGGGVISTTLHLVYLTAWKYLMTYFYNTPLVQTTCDTPFKGDLDTNTIFSKHTQLLISRRWVLSNDYRLSNFQLDFNKKTFLLNQYYNHQLHSNNSVNNHSIFFKNLFQTLALLKTTEDYTNTPVLKTGKQSYMPETANLSTLFKLDHLNSYLTLNLSMKKSQGGNSYSQLLTKQNMMFWNLNTIGGELLNIIETPTVRQWYLGTFYLFNEDFYKLNRRLLLSNDSYSTLNSIVEDQTKIFKWSRWLYRYNILHRKIIENSHKITNTKKLVSTGFFNSHLMSHNLWASNFFNSTTTQGLVKSNYQTLYSDTFQINNKVWNNLHTLKSSSNNNRLSNTYSYEKSFFFIIHRFQMFNRMLNLRITSNHTLRVRTVNNSTNINSLLTEYHYLVSTLLRTLPNLNDPFNFLTRNTSITNISNSNKQPTLPHNTKLIWKESEASSIFNLDFVNTLVNLSELSDLKKNTILVSSYWPINEIDTEDTLTYPSKKVKNTSSSNLHKTNLINNLLINDLIEYINIMKRQ